MSSGPIIGIDCGLEGGIAFLEGNGLRVEALPMPLVMEGVGRAVRPRIDLWRLHEILSNMHKAGATCAWVEKVSSQPTDGHVGAFSFGWSACAVSMGLACVGVRTLYVTPIVWKRAFKLGKDKNLSRLRASQLFPQDAHQWGQKNQDGLAEAALIGHYGRSIMMTTGGLAA